MANDAGILQESLDIVITHRRHAHRIELVKSGGSSAVFNTVIHDKPACWPSRQIISNSWRPSLRHTPFGIVILDV